MEWQRVRATRLPSSRNGVRMRAASPAVPTSARGRWRVPCRDSPCRQVSALAIAGIAWQAAPEFARSFALGQDRDAVIRPLSVPDRAVPGGFDGKRRKARIVGLDLLQAGDVGLGLGQPLDQTRQAAFDAVDVIGGYLQDR